LVQVQVDTCALHTADLHLSVPAPPNCAAP
jgi:hypothetical protein